MLTREMYDERKWCLNLRLTQVSVDNEMRHSACVFCKQPFTRHDSAYGEGNVLVCYTCWTEVYRGDVLYATH